MCKLKTKVAPDGQKEYDKVDCKKTTCKTSSRYKEPEAEKAEETDDADDADDAQEAEE